MNDDKWLEKEIAEFVTTNNMAFMTNDSAMAKNNIYIFEQAILNHIKANYLTKEQVLEMIGDDERLDIQSEYDKLDCPHLETDKYPGLDAIRQAARNLYRKRLRTKLNEGGDDGK